MIRVEIESEACDSSMLFGVSAGVKIFCGFNGCASVVCFQYSSWHLSYVICHICTHTKAPAHTGFELYTVFNHIQHINNYSCILAQ